VVEALMLELLGSVEAAEDDEDLDPKPSSSSLRKTAS
jgi:hypothetical protein